ncbi:MAG TPA: NUDIX domain-containing protein [Opitutus sp.]|nr:NUDIX domain-containing protein [Opitutus sp.]
MADEFFDVVNEHDEPVSRARRSEVHARGLRHRAVHILVFDEHGRVFLQKRSMNKDTSPGLWNSSCSGHVDAGEEYDRAAVRELKEELGLSVARPTSPGQAETPVRWFKIDACEETGREFCWIYRMRANGPFVLHPDEIEGGEWLAPVEVTERIAERPRDFSGPFRYLWAIVAEKLKDGVVFLDGAPEKAPAAR